MATKKVTKSAAAVTMALAPPAPMAADVTVPIVQVEAHQVGRETEAVVAELLPVLIVLAKSDADSVETREARKGVYATATLIAATADPIVWKAAAAEIDRRQSSNIGGLATKLGLQPNGREKGKFKLCRSWTACKYVLTQAHEMHVPMLDKKQKPISFGKIRNEVLGKVEKARIEGLQGTEKLKADILKAIDAIRRASESLAESRLDSALAALVTTRDGLLAMIAADATVTTETTAEDVAEAA